MKLYKDTGTNPFASCLPLLLQMPIFFALFRLLDQAAKNGTAHGLLTEELARKFGASEIFGVFPISESFWQARVWGAEPDGAVMVLALILVLAMTATTFTTQRQLMSKNMPADALSGPYAQQQKMLLYVLPVAFGLGGVAFPIGVLLYWTTSNLWTMGQQFYVIRNNPAPGTPAFQAKVDRDRAKAERKGLLVAEPEAPAVEEKPRAATRQQPKKQTRQQRRQGGTRPPGSAQAKPNQKNPSKGEES
jgi:YidC/Oxa1 family membrane protein insertase